MVDPDADGDPDVFGCKLNGGTTSCFLLTNNGTAGFTQTFSAVLAGNPIATTTAIGDAANRDLLDDVVVGFDDGSVLLFPNNGASGYAAPLAVYSTAGAEPISALAIGDTRYLPAPSPFPFSCLFKLLFGSTSQLSTI